jgi:hypothetical protein
MGGMSIYGPRFEDEPFLVSQSRPSKVVFEGHLFVRAIYYRSEPSMGGLSIYGARFEDEPFLVMIDSRLDGSTDFHSSNLHTRGTSLGEVPREQKMLKGRLLRVIYHQVY